MKNVKYYLPQNYFSMLLVLLAVLPALAVGWMAYQLMFKDIRSERIQAVGRVAEARHAQLLLLLEREKNSAQLFLTNLGIQCGGYTARLDQVCVANLIGSYLTSENAMGAMLRWNGNVNITIGASAVRPETDLQFKSGQLAQFAGTGPANNHAYFVSVKDSDTGLQLAVTYPSSSLQAIFARSQELGDSGETFLMDNAGYFVTEGRYPSAQGRSLPISTVPMQSCLNGNIGEAMDDDYRNVQIIHGFHPVSEFGSACIMAHVEQAEAFAPLAAMEKKQAAILLVFLLPAVWAALYIAKRVFKAEGAQLASENKFRILFESASDCMMMLGMDGRILEVNRAGHERLGYTREEMIGKRVSKFDSLEFAAQVPKRMAEIRDKGQAVFESVHQRKDGSVMPVEINARMIELDGLQRVYSIIRDISERKWLEQELREREARYRAVIETSRDGFWVTDVHGRFLEVNDAYVHRSGYSREELFFSMRISDVGATEHDEETAAHIRKVLFDGYDRFESCHRAKDGSIWPVEVVISYWPEAGGLLFAFVTDISERKSIERAILASEQRYRSLFDNLLNGFAHLKILYQDGQPQDLMFLEVNEVFKQITGLGDVVGKTGKEVLPDIRESNPELFEIGIRVALGGRPERFEMHVEKLHRWFAISVYCPETGYVVALLDDITERKRIEQMTSTRLDSLTRQANDIIFLTDVRGRLVDVNDRAIETYGYSGEEFSALDIQYLRAPGLVPSFEEEQQEIERLGAMRFDSVHVRKDGSEFPVDVSARLIRVSDEVYVQYIVRDISEQKLREWELLEKERRLVEAQHVAKLGSWEWSEVTGEVYWSDELYRIFGYDRRRPLPTFDEYLALYVPDSQVKVKYAMVQAQYSGRTTEFDLELEMKDGEPRWVFARFDPIRDTLWRIIGVRGTIQDITERKRQEALMEEASKEIADLYHHAPCGYHSLDKDGLFASINDTELSWLGYQREEIVGKMRLPDLLTPKSIQVFNETFPELKRQGLMRDIELELVSKDGSIRPVMISATAVRDKQGNFQMSRSMVYDMTERKKLEQEREMNTRRLAKLSQRMVAAQEQERRWLAADLHDRSGANLAALMLNCKLIAGQLPAKALEEVKDTLEDTQALLQDTVASIREICSNLRPIVLDQAGFWRALGEYAQQFSRRTGIAVHCDLDGSEPKLLPNVKSTLFRIAQEALTNIVKHAQASEVHIGYGWEGGNPVLTIFDNGRGFDPDEFAQSGHAPGLGLVTMRERAEFIGGRFSYESGCGRGMHIRIALANNQNIQ